MVEGEAAALTASKRDGRWTVERRFSAEFAHARSARGWLREMFSPACLVMDDCITVVSELLANAADHGGGGYATVTVTHGLGGILGSLVHEAVPLGVPVMVPSVVEEISRLLSLRGHATEVQGLAESGRGLAVVVALCEGAVEIRQTEAATVTGWALNGCGCEVASRAWQVAGGG